MSGINTAIILGRLGQDVELITTNAGKKIAKLSMATSKTWKDERGDKHEKTEWHKLVAFGKSAELLKQYCRKGDQLYIEGEISTRSYEKEQGDKRYITEIIINKFVFLENKKITEEGRDHKDVTDSGYTVDENGIEHILPEGM